jgi:hypothetical protein
MTQWNKFLGKIFFQEASENQEVSGCFIALSGVNGHVQGNYDELCQHRHNVSLIQGDSLLSAIAKISPFSHPQEINDLTRRLTQRVVMRYEAAYFNKVIYWIVVFDHSDFTILSGTGVPIDEPSATELVPLIQAELEVRSYIDLQAEAQSQIRPTMVQAVVFTTLVKQGGAISSVDALIDRAIAVGIEFYGKAFSAAELRNAISLLVEDAFLWIEQSSGQCSLPMAERADYLITALLPFGEFKRRYEDFTLPRACLVNYVASVLLQGRLKCFIQASVTAVHLGTKLLKSGIADGSLLYSNSVLLPLALLRPQAHFSVYSFAGSMYDSVSGGWLFPPSDCETSASLLELFARAQDPLTMALLSPAAVTTSGIYYESAETAHFCRILLTAAKQVVIMVTSDRICADEKVARLHCDSLDSWTNYGKSIALVIAGRHSEIHDVVERFSSEGVVVHWQDAASMEWRKTAQQG